MACKYIYKDADGKPSAIYERALEKYGPERAEEIYLKYMMSNIDTRFSKTLTEDLDKRAANIEATPDSSDKNVKSAYIESTTGRMFARVTSLLDSWTKTKSELFGAKTQEQALKEGKGRQAKEMIGKSIPPEYATKDAQDAYLREQYTKYPDLQERAERDVQSKWDASNKWGTEFHTVADVINKEWEAEYLRQIPDSNGNRSQLDIKHLPEIIEAAKKSLGSDRFREDNKYKDKFETNQLMYVFKPLYTAIQAKEREIALKVKDKNISSHLTLKSEQKVYTDKFKTSNAAYAGIGGSIDLFLVSQDNKINIPVDFKTKDADKVINFEKATGTEIHGPFDGEENTPKNRATDQMLLYGAIANAEYGLNVTDTMPVVIPLNFKEVGTNEVGSKEYTLQSIANDPDNKVIVYPPEPVYNRIEEVLTYFKVGSLPEYYDQVRKKGPSGVVETWSGVDKDGQPNATFSKYHKESYIAKKLTQIKTAPDGKKVIDFLNDRIDVTSMTDAQKHEVLVNKYNELEENNAKVGKDIITWFKDPDGKFPHRLHGKEITVASLMRGIDKSTHTLQLAQGAMPELEGIGPDVLLATEINTGAISLISAVSVMKSPVTSFMSDGSNEGRTSFLGKYATDKELMPGELTKNLISAPNTHDYLTMKLGIAALYLNRRTGGKLNIDLMRVGSILPGDRVYTTDTTPQEIFSKLELFQKYAGSDFPAEYSKLLTEVEANNYEISTADHLKSLMLHISNNTDPLGKFSSTVLKNRMTETYDRWSTGELVGTELKELLGKYIQTLSTKLTQSGKTAEQVQLDPRFQAASKAYMEYLNFNNDLGQLAKERISVPFLRGAVTSGDPLQMRLHVLYNEASAKIRKSMESHMEEHTRLLDALQKEKGVDVVGDSKHMFGNLFKDSTNDPTQRLKLKLKGTAEYDALTQNERNYIDFFNKSVKNTLLSVATDTRRPDINNGRFWEEGTVPVLRTRPSLFTKENFADWKSLRKAAGFGSSDKSNPIKASSNRSLLEFDYKTQFDNQATDDNVANSDLRRKYLGLSDPNAKGTVMDPSVETNLAMIVNLGALEASEKENYTRLLQAVVATQAITAAEGLNGRMTSDMIDTWKNLILFDRKQDETTPGLTQKADAINRLSSKFLFTLSIKQAMIEFTTGTMQNTSSLLSNMLQNKIAEFIGKPENSGRFTSNEWLWATHAWDKYDHKLEQMVYDAGMLCADSNDLKTEAFNGGNKSHTFYSEAGFWLNKLFFNTSINHTFLAQAKHLGIVDAYVNRGTEGKERWEYDETLDPRYFAYDKERGIGERPPETDIEKKKFSLWDAARHTLDEEGMLSPEMTDKDGKTITGGKRMLTPLTSNQRAEMKHYGTRLYGSFNKDTVVQGEASAIGRAMFRYKKWFTQRISNYWTPTIRNSSMHGHWEQIKDDAGNWHTHWMGDDFEGILQTVGFMAKELARTKSMAFVGHLNKYQRENASKLVTDMALVSMMYLMILPFLENKKHEIDPLTGEVKTTTGEWGKSMLGMSAYKAALNAASDMAIISAATQMTSSMFPGLSTAGTLAMTGLKNLKELVQPTGAKVDFVTTAVKEAGLGKTGISAFQTADKGFPSFTNFVQ